MNEMKKVTVYGETNDGPWHAFSDAEGIIQTFDQKFFADSFAKRKNQELEKAELNGAPVPPHPA